MPIIQPSDLPTLPALYKNGSLSRSSGVSPIQTPSASLNQKISIIKTSITNLATTSIVNAANSSLLGGGGVDGVIHRAAGPQLLDECRDLDGCEPGSAKITKSYELPSGYVIHAVGPIYASAKKKQPGLEQTLLRGCYRKSLDLAKEKAEQGKGGTIAFNCISTGAYGYPSEEAAKVALEEVRSWLTEHENAGSPNGKDIVDLVVFCLFEDKDVNAYNHWVPIIFPPADQD